MAADLSTFIPASIWWLISDISHLRYLANAKRTSERQTVRQNFNVAISPVLSLCRTVALSSVLSHCRSLVRFVALSLSRPFCSRVTLSCVLTHCRNVALSPILSQFLSLARFVAQSPSQPPVALSWAG